MNIHWDRANAKLLAAQNDAHELVAKWKEMLNSLPHDVQFKFFDGSTYCIPNFAKLVTLFYGSKPDTDSFPGTLVLRDSMGTIAARAVSSGNAPVEELWHIDRNGADGVGWGINREYIEMSSAIDPPPVGDNVIRIVYEKITLDRTQEISVGTLSTAYVNTASPGRVIRSTGQGTYVIIPDIRGNAQERSILSASLSHYVSSLVRTRSIPVTEADFVRFSASSTFRYAMRVSSDPNYTFQGNASPTHASRNLLSYCYLYKDEDV